MITIDIGPAVEELGAISARMSNMLPFMAMVGQHETEAAKKRITTLKTSPEGTPWAPWSARRRKERIAKGNEHLGLLLDTGTLLNSLHSDAMPSGVAIGTNVPYAPYLQEGTPHMPDRPFLGWTPGLVVETERLAVLFIEKGLLL